MATAYNLTNLKNLLVQKEVKQWMKQDYITREQFHTIEREYPCSFYHPNMFIRILLFAATLLGSFGAIGLLILAMDTGSDDSIAGACVFGGVVSIVLLEIMISQGKHYKSGVTEALLYFGVGIIIGGLIVLANPTTAVTSYVFFFLFLFAAIRYIDLIATLGTVLSFAFIVFNSLYEMGGFAQQIIPFVMMIVFGLVYFITRRARQNDSAQPWCDALLIIESTSLLIVYCGGNYFVVRELSIEMMELALEEGQDIPFAWIFYALTVIIPMIYLYFGIVQKNIVLIRVSLIVIAFAVFTFKYYFSLGHPEITLTIAGVILVSISLALLNYLKIVRHGFTRENHLPEKWAGMNIEAVVISQTLGGNQINVQDAPVKGGDFGGGGSSDSF
ncbi:hypothetical protein [Pseudochryseolinea flava]|uniref:DUF2157 domain-containing protein n=1 Tax=Pseudochryseolinea flava TaxID=2059302 RepID=A0A364Y000_9BACT|nr:hypothetical protein [Pseudochryseolinea flava]RAW00104.1 hypothetical protein DQQ10_16270 [Pseudochryseolinea flava]